MPLSRQSFRLNRLSIRSRLEILLLLTLMFAGIATSMIFYRKHMDSVLGEITHSHETSNRLFKRLIKSDSEGLQRALTGFSHNETLLKLFQGRERNQLAKYIAPYFHDLRDTQNITHAYFIDTKGVVFLRPHQPYQYGDKLKRATFLQTEQSQKPTCGIEMGKNFFSLRCVKPAYYAGHFIGYLEMAEEIDHLFTQLKSTTQEDFALLLSDEFIQNHTSRGKKSTFEEFDPLYDTNIRLLQNIYSVNELSKGLKGDSTTIHHHNGKHYAVGVSPFKDALGNTAGVFVSMKDISSQYNNAKQELLFNIGCILLVVLTSVIFFILAIKRAFIQLENQLGERTKQIEYMAMHDDLTGLANRSMFSKMVTHHIQQGKRYQQKFSLLFIDLDGFKAVNDNLGHDAGDQLLAEVAERLTSCVRESDVVARLGGDEFVLLLIDDPNYDGENDRALRIANRILESIAETYNVAGREAWVTASIGISHFPENGEDESQLTKHADAAMYIAKENGKNNIQCYSEEMHRRSFERLALEAGIRHALKNNEFELYYQAKVDTKEQKVIGMEALIRWNHPDLGIIEPGKFISIAEETGLIIPIGRWVINTACEQNMAWQKQGMELMPIAVNISARQFNDDTLIDDIKETLAITGMPADFLILEITEHMVIKDLEKANMIMNALKAIGIKIAIDDLGIGYSSFTSLESLSVDTIKIDRSFIQDLPNNRSRKAIAEAIISMGNKLGLTVIAEGVETAEQLEFLRQNQCEQLQGFYFNQPMPAENFKAFVKKHTNESARIVDNVPETDHQS